MGKTISFVKGKGSLSHNNRDFVADNVDKDRMDWNIYYIQQSLKEAYALLFTSAIEDYNSKQKRKSRWVTDYLSDIKNSGNNEKPFYEVVVQIGRKEDTGVLDADGKLSMDAEVAKMILDEYVRTFQERNPNLYLFNAVLHMDEATPHLHLDYIPVAHGYKTKMHTRNSLTKALQEMGIEPATSKLDTETMHWQKRERDYLMGICRERGLEVEFTGEKRYNYTIPEYKAARQAADELNAELEILNAEKQEAEAAIASINSVAEISREEVAESKQHLAEINAEIAEREKRYAVYEKKIDKVIAAGKPVKKELDSIRSRTKSLPVILGGEASIKISEKDFERIMDMAQASGTLEKLNEAYDRDIDLMQGKIDKLTTQVKTLKDKLEKCEAFVKAKGFLEEFVEYLRPKKIEEQLAEKKKISAERYQQRQALHTKKKDINIAI